MFSDFRSLIVGEYPAIVQHFDNERQMRRKSKK
jgi:hypothetical protein